ncbi:hypothetical protein [Streptococcus macacae]|uniref:PF11457 family protein n=1 Tax=Streptococcus macacae NCTC 11558 TaxID=764298 RepID=G5JW41_9STRE|nr:hypothetical protein [Streptococcus macacae]EHJ52617.1 hypothetical protein STRMA_1455 [Streptococcus macacae NCTC 11558]SUN79377.1 Uncharacterised protein [Streptococcus macacae NCTC 11558]
MKKLIVNILATTSLSLVLLSLVALFYYQAHVLYLATVFQVLAANVLIHLSFLWIERCDIKNRFLELLGNILVIEGILLLFSWCFNWLSTLSLWLLVTMGAAFYFCTLLLDIFYIKRTTAEINDLIKRRHKR